MQRDKERTSVITSDPEWAMMMTIILRGTRKNRLEEGGKGGGIRENGRKAGGRPIKR